MSHDTAPEQSYTHVRTCTKGATVVRIVMRKIIRHIADECPSADSADVTSPARTETEQEPSAVWTTLEA